jgi:hypothetical protein
MAKLLNSRFSLVPKYIFIVFVDCVSALSATIGSFNLLSVTIYTFSLALDTATYLSYC